jgi:primosomal protein N''
MAISRSEQNRRYREKVRQRDLATKQRLLALQTEVEQLTRSLAECKAARRALERVLVALEPSSPETSHGTSTTG